MFMVSPMNRRSGKFSASAATPQCDRGACRSAGRDPPHRVADVVGDDQRAGAIDGHADRASARVAALEEAGDEVDRRARGTAVLEANEHDLVTVEVGAIPAAVLA